MVLNQLPEARKAEAEKAGQMAPLDENALMKFISTNDIDEAQARAKAIERLSKPGRVKEDESLKLLSKTMPVETF